MLMRMGIDQISRQVIHPKLERHVRNRLKCIESGRGIDFATAEVGHFVPALLSIKTHEY
jgi:hypothetical protein